MKKFIELRVFFLVANSQRSNLVSLVKGLLDDGDLFFKIDDENFFSHVTIYMGEYPLTNKKVIINSVKKYAGEQKAFSSEVNGLSPIWGGYLGVNLVKSAEIRKIHKDIINLLNPFREGKIREKYHSKDELSKFSGKERAYIRRCGDPFVFSEYHPHLTLALFKSGEKAEKVMKNFPVNSLPNQLKLNMIGIGECGDNGTVTKIIKKFKLND